MVAIPSQPAGDFVSWVTRSPDDGIIYGVVRQTNIGSLLFVASFPADYDPELIVGGFRLQAGEAMVCFRKQDDGSIVPVAKRKSSEKPSTAGYASLY